ncbi:serine protease Hayan-like [Melitaea cinxia]|uniref:serine protease Hayan-like n=1 Tax=Melitaea cinxia TaxID=113334 RepID=UPI001E27409B|nr:serine protease Hayan-like [Melitaea cinxia]
MKGALGWKAANGSWLFLCGSSLISERFVLTAAHCTKVRKTNLMNPNPEIVRLGAVNIYNSSRSGLADVKIKNIIVHPNYKPPEKYYDIALIELETTVNFTKYVHPACLNTKPAVDIKNNIFTVTGWGETENRTTSHHLLSATVDLFDSNCSNLVLNRNWWGPLDQHLCAGKLDGSVDTCYGDSGGPLQYKLIERKDDGTMHMIVAITTFGARKCAKADTPTVYTQVSTFIEWIENHVWQDEKQIVE